MGDDNDATNVAMVHIQESNNVSTHFFLSWYNANVFNDTIEKVPRKSVTKQHLTERIERIQQATTHGNLFYEIGGGHLTDDDIFFGCAKEGCQNRNKRAAKAERVCRKDS